MATHTIRSQTCTAAASHDLPSWFEILSTFQSNQQGPETANIFHGFSACHTPRSTSQAPQQFHSPTSVTHLIELLPDKDDTSETTHHMDHSQYREPPFHTPLNDEHLLDEQGPPRDEPLYSDDPNNNPDNNPDDNDLFNDNQYDAKYEDDIEQVPHDTLVQLTSAISSLTHSTCHPTSKSAPHTKVWELDQFDKTDPCKLQTFLVQCKLNFQDHPKAFIIDHTKVTFVQSYLKGMALEWFEPDLLQMEDPALKLNWMNDFKEFILELQTNVRPHDLVRDVEHWLDHLSMKDGQCISKYVIKFNRITSQVWGYGEGALWHHFYNGLPNCIKDEISWVRKPMTLYKLHTLIQAIDACYWERKSEVNCQAKPSNNPSTMSSNKPTASSFSGNNSGSSKDSNESKGKSTSTSTSKSNILSKLGKDGKLTAEEWKCRFDNKLCIFCGNAGHMAKNCPKSSLRASKGHATTIETLEAKLVSCYIGQLGVCEHSAMWDLKGWGIGLPKFSSKPKVWTWTSELNLEVQFRFRFRFKVSYIFKNWFKLVQTCLNLVLGLSL